MATIDRDKLIELASDPKQSTATISEALGLGQAHNLYYELNKDPQLKESFRAARMEASEGKPSRQSARAPKTRAGKKRASGPNPPRNGNAKGGINPELLRKIILEFNHIDVYGTTSEHFAELRQQMGALL